MPILSTTGSLSAHGYTGGGSILDRGMLSTSALNNSNSFAAETLNGIFYKNNRLYTWSHQRGSYNAVILSVIDNNGNVVIQKQYKGEFSFGVPFGVMEDSSGNIHMFMSYKSFSGSTPEHVVWIKYNNSGTEISTKYLRLTDTTPIIKGLSVTIDSSDNIYILCGETNLNPHRVIKMSASGTIAWAKTISISEAGLYLSKIAVDSTGNIYIAGSTSAYGKIIKMSSAGAITWQKDLLDVISVLDIAFDSSDNPYIVGQLSPFNRSLIVKLNGSTGAWLWGKRYAVSSGGTVTDDFVGVIVDVNDIVTVIGTGWLGGTLFTTMFTFDTSGTLLTSGKIHDPDLIPFPFPYGQAVPWQGKFIVKSSTNVYVQGRELRWESNWIMQLKLAGSVWTNQPFVQTYTRTYSNAATKNIDLSLTQVSATYTPTTVTITPTNTSYTATTISTEWVTDTDVISLTNTPYLTYTTVMY